MTTDPRRHSRQVALFRKLVLACALLLLAVLVVWSDPQARLTRTLSDITNGDQSGI